MGANSTLRRWGGICGIVGPILLAVYFAAPAFTGWPFDGAPADQLIAYTNGHALLFYAGAWLQATGAGLSILFFLAVLQLSGCRGAYAGLVTAVACSLLLAVVLAEAAFLVAVPAAAAAGDRATVATTFALSNGVYAHVFPLAPAPLLLGGVGAILLGTDLLPRQLAWAALVLAGLFELAGIAAVFATAGLVFAIVMSVVQELWIVAAAIALLRPARSTL